MARFAFLLEKVFQTVEASNVKLWTPMIQELCKDEHLNSVSVFVSVQSTALVLCVTCHLNDIQEVTG